MEFKSYFFILIFFSFISNAFSSSLDVFGGTVDILGTQKILKIFVSDDPFKQFIVMGNEKYDIVNLTPDYIVGRIKKFNNDGTDIENRYIAIYKSQNAIAQAQERSQRTFSLNKQETLEKPCSTNANAVINAADTINNLRSYIDNGYCFEMTHLNASEGVTELTKTLNADGTINSQGAYLINGDTEIQIADNIKGQFVFFSPTIVDPKFYKGLAHYSAEIHVTHEDSCPEGDYIVSGSAIWDRAQSQNEMGRIKTLNSISRGPKTITIQINGMVIKEQGTYKLNGLEFHCG